MAGVPIEIRTEHLPNTSLEHYHHASSLSERVPENTAAIQVQSVKCDIWDFTASICHCVAFQVVSNDSDEVAASIFKVNMNMDAKASSKTFVTIYTSSKQRYNREKSQFKERV